MNPFRNSSKGNQILRIKGRENRMFLLKLKAVRSSSCFYGNSSRGRNCSHAPIGVIFQLESTTRFIITRNRYHFIYFSLTVCLNPPIKMSLLCYYLRTTRRCKKRKKRAAATICSKILNPYIFLAILGLIPSYS